MPFPAIHLFRVIPAAGGFGHGVGGADRLGVDHRRGRLGVPPGGSPDLGAQPVVQPGQRAVIAPGGEVPVHRPPRREVRGQVPPGAPGPVHVQDRLHDPAQRPDPRSAPPLRHHGGQVRGDNLPLDIGQVTGIAPGPPPGPAPTRGTRGLCFSGRHTPGSWGPRARPSQPDNTRATRGKPVDRASGRFIKHSLSPFEDSPDEGYYFAPSAALPSPDMKYEEKCNRDACYDELVAERRVIDVFDAVQRSLIDAISFQWTGRNVHISVNGGGILPSSADM